MPFVMMPMTMFLKLTISTMLLYVIVLNAVGIQSRVHHRHRMERSPMVNTLPTFREVFEVENSTEDGSTPNADEKMAGEFLSVAEEVRYDAVEPLSIPPVGTDGFYEEELGVNVEITNEYDTNGVLVKPRRSLYYYFKTGVCIGGVLLVIVMYYLADMYFDDWFAKRAFCMIGKDDDDEEEEEDDGEDEEEADNEDDVENFYQYMPEIPVESGDEDEGEENRG